MKGEKEKALQMYIDINPIVLQDEIVFANNDEALDVAGYLSYVIGMGLNQDERFKNLTNIYCDYRYEQYEDAEIEAVRKYREWDVAECEFYKGNVEHFLELIRKQYFEY
ncbi:MAG TPA: hypothetical protein DCL80_08965, partial [Balneola sp.]|nr:hypothetical protein [Balneola sp.]